RRLGALIAEVVRDTRSRNDDVAQVSAAVAELDALTQQNAALVEQSAAASTNLQEQARTLAASVARFRLEPAARTPA
ncbi:MAG TPA: hypothetical protein VEA81_19420, partial [Burkholderiaceae bacterium]|nr:hypothetical protein [Burkholderiaceae bacterium]